MGEVNSKAVTKKLDSETISKIKDNFLLVCIKKRFTRESFKKYIQTNLKDVIRYNNMVFEHLFRLFITTGGPIKGKHGSSNIELKQQTFEVGCGVVLIQNENLITDDPKLPPWHKILFNVLDLDMDGRITKSNVAVWFNLFITSTLREICPSACYDSDEEDEDDAGFDYIDKIVDKFFLLKNHKGDDPQNTMTYEDFQKIADKKSSKVPFTLNSLLVVLTKYVSGLLTTPSQQQQQQQLHSQFSLQSNTSEPNTPTVCSGSNAAANNTHSISSGSQSPGIVPEIGEPGEKKKKSFFFKKKKTFSTPGPIPPISTETVNTPESGFIVENGSPVQLASSFSSAITQPGLPKKRDRHIRNGNLGGNGLDTDADHNSERGATESPRLEPFGEDLSDNDDEKRQRGSLKIVIKPKEREATPVLRASSSLSSVNFMKPPVSSSSRRRIIYNKSSSSLRDQSEISTKDKSYKSDSSSKDKPTSFGDHDQDNKDKGTDVSDTLTENDKEKDTKEKDPELKKENDTKKKRSEKQKKHKRSSHTKKGSGDQRGDLERSKPLPLAQTHHQKQDEDFLFQQQEFFDETQKSSPCKPQLDIPTKEKTKGHRTLIVESSTPIKTQTKQVDLNENIFNFGTTESDNNTNHLTSFVTNPFDELINIDSKTTIQTTETIPIPQVTPAYATTTTTSKDNFIDDFFFTNIPKEVKPEIFVPKIPTYSDPGPDATFRFGMCMKNLESGNYKRGIDEARKALEMLPDNVEPRCVRLVMSYFLSLSILERLTHQRPLPQETTAWLGSWLASLPMHREHKETCMLIASLYSDTAARAAGCLVPECNELGDMCNPQNDLKSPISCRNCGSYCDASLPRCFICGTPILFCYISLAPITGKEYKVCDFCSATFSKAAFITLDDCPLCGRTRKLRLV